MQSASEIASIDPWPRDAVLRESRWLPPLADVATHVLASSPSAKTLEVFAWYARLYDCLQRISDTYFPKGSTVSHERIVECLAAADGLREQCFRYLEWIRTGYAGTATSLYRFSGDTLH